MTKTIYKLYKNDLFIGYIMGTFHSQLNPQNYVDLQEKLKPYLDKCIDIFLECDLPHYTTLPFGYEKAILHYLDQHKDKKLHALEALTFQQAMLNNSVWIGSFIRMLPWASYTRLQQYPKCMLFVAQFIHPFIKIYNHFYNIFTNQAHTKAFTLWRSQQQEAVIAMYQKFEKGNAPSMPSDDAQHVFMHERNTAWIKKIENHLNATNGPTLFAVGAAHLPNEDGLVKLLQKEGFVCIPAS